MTSYNIEAILDEMSDKLKGRFSGGLDGEPLMIGIHTGGVWVAEALHKRMGLSSALGTLNISFYRDDFTRIGMHPQVLPSKMESSVEGRSIILVDDVLYTGRTIRAAINEIFDYGRPGSITLVSLIERDGRELPIQADVVGLHMKLESDQQVKLSGPSPLELSVTGGARE
ncbi:MAG: bifunctional pyr operon transcriptional regulator/uracil phosphoribosyltransferase PyrR [Gammaproteobacteria bacterium]|nr:bifunctional pyr operon transcriptional regulator/uracil phosphoribosyltransferase PyrR [Gammaproteobacteria bacterium]